MKSKKLTSVIRKKKRYIQITPQITYKNILNRNFTSKKPNEKQLTYVTEFKLTKGSKAYLRIKRLQRKLKGMAPL